MTVAQASDPDYDFEDEAAVLTQYLLGDSPSAHHIELYSRVMTGKQLQPNQTVSKHSGLLHYIDAHDALLSPNSDIRQRLYLMFAILEASPEFTDKFLPRERSNWFILTMPFVGIRAVFRLLVGVVVVKAIRP